MASTDSETNITVHSNEMTSNTRKPASEHDPRLQLLNIAQELQDMIYEYTFGRHVHIDQGCVEADWDGPALLLALYTNSRQDICRRAKEIYFKSATFHIKQEHLLPWLEKHKAHAKYIKKIMVAPTDEIKEEDGTPWIATSAMALPSGATDPAEKVLWLTTRTLIDTQCALHLQNSTVNKMYEEVEGAGITIQREIIQVPVKFAIPDDTVTLWCESPVKEVVMPWRDRMDKVMKDLLKAVEGGDDGDGGDVDVDAEDSQRGADDVHSGDQ